MKLKIIILLNFLIFNSYAQKGPELPPLSKAKSEEKKNEKTVDEKKQELVDFKAIKDLLKNDQLKNSVNKKASSYKKKDELRKKRILSKYKIPSSANFWSFFTEYWLVKRATTLKWDFRKPDYGIQESFKAFLENLGYYEVKFKILIVDSPNAFHFALPSNSSEYIFLISLPFIRTLDLSKLEISILLFEDFLRTKLGQFKSKIMIPGLNEYLGGNFHKKKFNKALFDKLMKKYDQIIFEKGFSFQEQFSVTRNMGTIFKNHLKLWGVYYKMLEKIDVLVKSNLLFKKYNSIYPSPELQMGWLKPKKGPL